MKTTRSALAPGSTLPQNLEAEMKLLGACMHEASVVDDVISLVSRDDFYREAHGDVFREIVAAREAGQPTDCVVIGDRLERAGLTPDSVDELLGDIMLASPSAANAAHYAEIVRDKAIRRSLLQLCVETADECYSATDVTADLVCRTEEKVFGLSDRQVTRAAFTMPMLVDEFEAITQLRMRGEIEGIRSGYPDLDGIIGGFMPGYMIVLGARPSQGKTALALDLCRNVAGDNQVLFVSLEMSRGELIDRMVSQVAMLESRSVKNPKFLSRGDWDRMYEAQHTIRNLKLHIDEDPSRTASDIAGHARRIMARDGLSLVVIDYLNLIDSPENTRDSRQETIAKISRTIKKTARMLRVPVLVLSQLNRAVEGREDHRPRMSDLRESGAVEQDADVVMLLHRPEYYDPTDQPGLAELIVAKNRNGPIGTVPLTFLKAYTHFESVSNRAPGEQPF